MNYIPPICASSARVIACASPSKQVIAFVLGPWLLWGGWAHAQDISDETTTPVRTSSINDGEPGDVFITEDGSIDLAGQAGTTAVTVDSDNNVTVEGIIEGEDTDDLIGIAIEANRTGSITIDGSISFLEDYSREDQDDDDDLDGPLAIGQNRTGILLQTGGPFTGDVTISAGASISIEGNDSAGVQLLSGLSGNFGHDGAIGVTGDNAIGLDFQSSVSGDVLISGSVTTRGVDAIGVSLGETVGGNVTVESTISTTGFVSNAVSNFISPLNADEDDLPVEERIDAEDLQTGGPALAIGGSLGQGLLINGFIDDFISEEDAEDETKDTIEDFDENRLSGSILSVGSAPALLISPDWGDASRGDIVLGRVTETVRDTLDDDEDENFTETLATFDYDQGLINRGTITSSGLNVGFDATAIRLEGSADGLYTTEIVGGILNSGTIQAVAYDAESLAIDLAAGAIVGSLQNEGTILAETDSTETNGAVAVHIRDGANLTTIENSGRITAQSSFNGATALATTILDESGTLTRIENRGTISAVADDYFADADIEGESVALNLAASNSDIVIRQQRETPIDDVNGDDEIDEDDVATPIIIGDILLGTGNDTIDISAGSIIGDSDFGFGDAAFQISDSDYFGDIRFGDGVAKVDISDSEVFGDLEFITGTGDLRITDGSVYSGQIVTGSALVSAEIDSSEVTFSSGTAAQFQSLSITGDTQLRLNIDPRLSAGEPTLQVAGVASIGNEVTVQPVLETISSTDFTQTLIAASDIAFDGELDSSFIADIPYIYEASLELVEDIDDQLDLVFSLKSAEALGLDLNQSAAYDSLLDVFSSDDELGAALAAITEQDEFEESYNQLLPQRSDSSTRFLASLATAATGALSDRLDEVSRDGRGAWAQEYFTSVDIDATTDVPGYNGASIGFALGYDAPMLGLDRIGLYGTYASGDFEEKTGGNNPVTTDSLGVGVYLAESVGPLIIQASGQVSALDFYSDREIDIDDLAYEIEGSWTGVSTSANLATSTNLRAGRIFAQPKLSLDYLSVQQDAYTETGDDQLAAEVGESDTETSSVTLATVLGAEYGNSLVTWSPEMKLGFRHVLSQGAHNTTVRYLGTDESFVIDSQDSISDALLAGFAFNSKSDFISARFGYDAEISEDGITHYGGATVKVRF